MEISRNDLEHGINLHRLGVFEFRLQLSSGESVNGESVLANWHWRIGSGEWVGGESV